MRIVSEVGSAYVGTGTVMTIDRVGGVLVARLGARYDAFHEEEASRFEDELIAAVAGVKSPRVVLDLSQTEYFSSSTIETLFRLWKTMEASGDAKMAFAAPSAFCRETVTTARLNDLWPIYDTVDAAVKELRS
jgi:anti-anti-sigma factor